MSEERPRPTLMGIGFSTADMIGSDPDLGDPDPWLPHGQRLLHVTFGPGVRVAVIRGKHQFVDAAAKVIGIQKIARPAKNLKQLTSNCRKSIPVLQVLRQGLQNKIERHGKQRQIS